MPVSTYRSHISDGFKFELAFTLIIFTLCVLQVLQRIDDVSLMCDKRIASLKKLALKPPRPVQQVTPEPAVPLQPPGGAPHLLRRKPNKVSEHLQLSTKVFLSIYCVPSPPTLITLRNKPNFLCAARLQPATQR